MNTVVDSVTEGNRLEDKIRDLELRLEILEHLVDKLQDEL